MSTWACTPRSSSRALFFAAILALLLVFVFSVPASATDFIVNDDAGCDDSTGSPSYCHIQPAIDAAAATGDTIKVYPGSYDEMAVGRWVLGTNGPHQFGLFIDKNNLTIQGVDAGGAPITDAAAAAAYVTTNATNNFGASGIFVQGDGVTISGLKIGPNAGGDNKTFEVAGDSFTLKNSWLAVPDGGGALYFGEWRFDPVNNESYIKSYTIEGNLFDEGATIAIASGAGYSGPVNSRQIKDNKFVYGPGYYWPAISFSGKVPTVGWFVYPVGGAIITGNEFSGGEQYIRARGEYPNAQFDWQSYWNDNTFDRKAVTLADPATFDVRPYSYTSGSYVFNDVRRIGALIQPEIANAQPGDTIQIGKGIYAENLTANKHVKLIGAGSGSDPAANTVLRRANPAATEDSAVTITGSGASDADPLLLKNLRVEPQGDRAISLGLAGSINWNTVQSVSYIRLENVQVVGTPSAAHTENERCLNLELNKSVAHLTVVDSGFSQCDHGWYFTKHNGAITPNTAQFITVYNSNFTDNSYKGIYVELLSDATFDDVLVTGNGLISNWNGAFNAGVDVNLKAGVYQNLIFRNLIVTGNGLGAQHGAGLLVKARDDGGTYGPNPASLTNVLIEGGIYSGNERGIRIGEPGKSNAGPINVQIHNASITGNVKTYAGTNGSAYGGLVNDSKAAVNAEYNWWGSGSGPTNSGNPGGTGEVVTNASTGSIDYTPWLGMAPSAALIVPGDPVDLPTGATSFTLPVNLDAAAGNLSSAAFSLDYDTACLSINPADANGDGIPDAISGLPGGFVNSVMLDTADTDGELDVAMWDVTPPLAALPAGAIAQIKFDILPACQGPLDKTTFVKFSSSPAATFSDADGNAVYRNTQSADPLLLDYNAAATDIDLSGGSVDENKPLGTVVGTLSTNDADGDTQVYTLVGGCSGGDADNASFAISGATLSTAAVFNFEVGVPTKTVCVEVNDGQGGVYKQSLTVTVNDVNEPPTDISLSNDEVAEGAPVGTVVGTFSTTGDPETAQTHAYTLEGGDGAADNGKFEIVGNQLKTMAAVDYATQSVYYIRVRSTDNGTPAKYFDKQFVINVLDHSLLSIAETHVVRHGLQIGIPVLFTANGNTPSSASFGVAYNAACLAYVSTSGGTGSAASGVVTVNTNGPFDNGELVTITFSAIPSCTSGTSVLLDLTAASLDGGAFPVDTDDGKVLVISNSARGDCNSDGFVNAGDFSAIVLETFDEDDPWWLEAPKPSFPGSPVGCDANASQYIDVADVVCTVLVVFGNSSCTGGGLLAADAAAEPALLSVAPVVNGGAVSIPVTLDGKGAAVAGAAFTLHYDPTQAVLDESDADSDGIPDAISFATAAGLKRSVSVDAANGRIKIAVYGLSLPLPTIEDGVIATVRLQTQGDAALDGVALTGAALGNISGGNTPVDIEVSGAGQTMHLYLPAINN